MTEPAGIGFSPERLARIETWYQAQINAGSMPALPGAVVAIARNGKLAYSRGMGRRDAAE